MHDAVQYISEQYFPSSNARKHEQTTFRSLKLSLKTLYLSFWLRITESDISEQNTTLFQKVVLRIFHGIAPFFMQNSNRPMQNCCVRRTWVYCVGNVMRTNNVPSWISLKFIDMYDYLILTLNDSNTVQSIIKQHSLCWKQHVLVYSVINSYYLKLKTSVLYGERMISSMLKI